MRTYDTFSHEFRKRAVSMVRERLTQHPTTRAAANSVAAELGCSLSAVSTWLARARNERWLEWLRRNNSDEGQAEIVALLVAQDERIERLEIQLARSTRMSEKLRAKGRLERLAKTRAQARIKALLARLAQERQARRRAETASQATTTGPDRSGNVGVRRGPTGPRPLDIFQRLARHLQRARDGKQAGPIAPEQIANVVNGSAEDEFCWLWTGGVGPSVKMRTSKSGEVRPGIPYIRVAGAHRQRVVALLHELSTGRKLSKQERFRRCQRHPDCVNPTHRPLRVR